MSEPTRNEVEQFISDNWNKDFFVQGVQDIFSEEIADYLDK